MMRYEKLRFQEVFERFRMPSGRLQIMNIRANAKAGAGAGGRRG
jgi:hypothetical protein